MKKITLLFMVCALAFSCAIAQNKTIPFKEAKRYFVRNDYPERNLHMLKITDEEKFNSIFGMATVMGKDGQPTPIDFSKEFAIALIDDTNDKTEDILVKSLTKEGDKLLLIYDIKKQKTSSFQRRFCTIIIVDNQYLRTVIANQYSKEPIDGGDLDELGCKPSTGHSWSFLKNDCIQPWMSDYKLEGAEINNAGNGALLFNEDRSKAEIMGYKVQFNIVLTKKSNENVWVSNDFVLTETQKGYFIFKDKDKEIAQGKLRK